ncbi:arginine decarboxylase [Aegilops tauschii subsp. strangulata]|uniref:Arginine decarboxylase n=1 Tax=Aegilops tauschii subsp. strangulata TaxID=200361 RepID=A0A452XJM8_AEGTS|nr:arginine decarboxylase [Aegilops tauschii subsp. strangulata]
MAAQNYGELYNILGWGEPYFTVNREGHLCVKTHGHETKPGQEIDVVSVAEAAKEKGVQFPMILRFPDVLKHRLDSLHVAFEKAIKHTGYTAPYQGVYPVKVNQNRAIINDFVSFGHRHSYGLEAGSKPELLIAMSYLTKAKPGAFLVCNGYKDAEYVALALSARAMGLNVIIVLEMEEELDIIIEQSSKLGVEPVVGVRAKLLTKIPGHFGSTAGKHGKFGLLADKIYEVAKKLKDLNKLHWLKLLHFHIGSMIPTTDIVSSAAREASGIYCTLVKQYGADMTTLDCGGGLGVDYDGTRSGSSDMSVAYGLEEYASSIVQAVRLTCEYNGGIPHPVLCTESGRAMVSHHSMIILEALSAIPEPKDDETPEQLHSKIQRLSSNPPPPRALMATDLQKHATDIQKHGVEMYKLAKKLAKRIAGDANTIYNYHMNLSIFSLVPDFWGIKHLFPMMPASRLNEKPTQMGTLIDITCDSDGKIDKFIGNAETLPLHPLDPESGGYYVAVLLSGAYQEALSCKHNLFGGPSIVRVKNSTGGGIVGGGGGFDIATADSGPTTEELISTVGYDVKEDIRGVIEQRAREKGVWEKVGAFVHAGLTSMPYLVEYKVPRTA